MTQKNETLPLVAALAITAAIVAGGGWWLYRSGSFNLSRILSGSSSPPQNPPNNPVNTPANDPQAAPQDLATVNVPSGLFNYGGSTTWAPIRGEIDPQIQQVHSQFQLRYVDPVTGTPGSGRGIQMLLDNQLDFAQSSRPLQEEEFQAARSRGFELDAIPVAIDSIAIAVHPDLEVEGLSVEQLRGIYAGEITNWQSVGGPDLAITPYSRRPEDGGTVEFFLNNILGGDLGNNVELVRDTTDGLRQVGSNPGGIYYASSPEVVPQCSVKTLPLGRTADRLVAPYAGDRVPTDQCAPGNRTQLDAEVIRSGEYPVTRRLFVIVKRNGGREEQAGEAYANLLLTVEGQQLLEQTDFVGIR